MPSLCEAASCSATESFRSELVAKCYRIVTDNDPAIVHAFAVNQVEPNGGRRRSLGVTVVHPARRGVMDEQNEVLESLAEKLNSLALNEEERAAFGALLGAETGEGEVEGFAKRIYVGNLPLIQGFNDRYATKGSSTPILDLVHKRPMT